MTLKSELQHLNHDEEIIMIEMSGYNKDRPGETFYCSNNYGVTFGGIPYVPLAFSIEGIAYSSEGAPPRPKLQISDADKKDTKIISGMIYFFGGLEGSTVVIRKTLRRFLDTGIEPNYTQEKPKDIFVISQKIQEVPGKFIEFELSAAIDFVDEIIGRPAITVCPYVYRNAASGCPYVGSGYYTINNSPTLTKKDDDCNKTVDACKARFGENTPLPHGGFPGLQRY